MRILYFHQHFTTRDGSGGTRSYEFARALISRGHHVTMVCGENQRAGLVLPYDECRRWSRGVVDGIDVVALPLPYSNRDGLMRRAGIFLRFAWRSIQIARNETHDLLFATSTPLTSGIPGIAMRLSGRCQPFVFEVRDLWPELPRALGMKNPILLGGMSALEWLAYRFSSACVGLAPGIVAGIRRRSGENKTIEMIPNGCDLGLFDPDRRAALALPGIETDDFVAGYTGAHGVANGLDAVLDAAAELKRRGRTGIKFVLIGDGNQKDKLVARARSEQLYNVLFFPLMKKSDVAQITASFDCGLMILANVPAFYYGTSPNKFFDYIAAGIPVLNNYPGWVAELISEYDCGIAVPPNEPVRLAEALCAMADDRTRSSAMGGRARALAVARFDRERLAKEWISFIERIANEGYPEKTTLTRD